LGAVSLVTVEREAVDHERVAEEVQELAGVSDAVGGSEPEGVSEVAVDRFGVVATRERRAKSGSVGGMGRTLSVRLNFRASSSASACRRTVMRWFPYRSGRA
jgi:hypothetical protein